MSKVTRHLAPLHTLWFFEAVARTKSFTAAARELRVTQSAVSKQVNNLEVYLNAPLFVRGCGSAELTDTGERLIGCVETFLGSFDRALSAMQAQQSQ
ncbi:HTH-type transcriptional activator AmpR [compost metagenome]